MVQLQVFNLLVSNKGLRQLKSEGWKWAVGQGNRHTTRINVVFSYEIKCVMCTRSICHIYLKFHPYFQDFYQYFSNSVRPCDCGIERQTRREYTSMWEKTQWEKPRAAHTFLKIRHCIRVTTLLGRWIVEMKHSALKWNRKKTEREMVR